MDLFTYLSLQRLMLVGTWTPGPNNALLANSGLKFGIRRSVPHGFGVALGFGVMAFAVGLGLGEIYRRFPVLSTWLSYISAALVIYIAVKIATAPVEQKLLDSDAVQEVERPWTFFQAVMFQLVNPKAWAMAIGAAGIYVNPENVLWTSFLLGFATLCAGLTSAPGWIAFGTFLSKLLNTPLKRRIFNYSMGFLLLYFSLPFVFGAH